MGRLILASLMMGWLAVQPVAGQEYLLSSNVVVPQSRSFSVVPAENILITKVEAGVVITEQAAVTTLDVHLQNPHARQVQAEVVLPVPDGAVVKGFTFQGAGKEPSAQLLPKAEARKIYDQIVAKLKDPALLEFVGYNLIRSSVFPVEASGTQRVRITYEHLLPAHENRVDYVLPRSESLDYHVPWTITVKIQSKSPISTVYSPSHPIQQKRLSPTSLAVQLQTEQTTEPGSFRLSYLADRANVTVTSFAYPSPKIGGGYFLLLSGLSSQLEESEQTIKREVTVVLDRSGSMRGEKIEQAREAALQILGGLEPGEAFNIITYNDSVDQFAAGPTIKTKDSEAKAAAYIQGIQAQGGTNIHDALLTALRQEPAKDMLPIVLFLTDGLPTVGVTSEAEIRDVGVKGNPHQRRIFTFGVGVDVNTPLLDKIALASRAKATYVLPKEDVEVKVGEVFKSLNGPVLSDLSYKILNADGQPEPGRVRDVLPQQLPDLFRGDQLLLLGQYRGEPMFRVVLQGNYLGKRKEFSFEFHPDTAHTKNAFVSRLWASRKIGILVDAIRQTGAQQGAYQITKTADPKLKELTEEILTLTKEFGILTEYTAFLAREGTNLNATDDVLRTAVDNFDTRAVQTRYGLSAVNQSFNNEVQLNASCLNSRNCYLDANLNQVTVTNVQQINDRTYFRQNGQWVDGRLLESKESSETTETPEVKPQQVIEFGSPEFQQLLDRLVTEGRQGTISLQGDILMQVDGQPVLIKAPVKPAEEVQK